MMLFPTAVSWLGIRDNSFVEQLEYEVQKLKNSGDGTSDERDFVTVDNLQELPQFSKLVEFLNFEINSILDEYALKRDSHKITNMWANITGPKNRHPIHIHPNSLLSGVVYLKTPKDCAPLILHDPRPSARIFEPEYENGNYLNMALYEHKPKAGDVLIWPSWLPHGIEKGYNDDSEDRVVISFNVMISGIVTTKSAKMEIE